MAKTRQAAAPQNSGLGIGAMAIGEFGGAAAVPASFGPTYATPAYWLYEMSQASLSPARAFADAGRLLFKNPANPWTHTELGKSVAAACELFERSTRRYGKPEWDIASTLIGAERVPVHISTVWERPFCRLQHFERMFEQQPRRPQPKLLVVAPMSGHYATLLRGTVEGFLPNHDVYITEWTDARVVPLAEGRFDLDDYIDYLISMLHFLGGDVHVIAVCQPSVPVLAAVARMEADGDPHVPHSMVLMGGPIDTRINPTEVNLLAGRRGIDWFRHNVITKVPFPNPGFMRDVYPGFLQLYGFMTMNLDRHMQAHRNLYLNLIKGDGDSAQKHREFYDEYLAVMDLCAEFYLQTCETVFIRHALPLGEMTHRGVPIDPSKIKRVALMTVEGENDDISGVGQTEAAHSLCTSIPADRKYHWLQPEVGHYGVFNGSRFRAEIAPRISDFVLSNNADSSSKKTSARASNVVALNGNALAHNDPAPARSARSGRPST
jgi:poly(3-hydroxybutyrate) depolymerase